MTAPSFDFYSFVTVWCRVIGDVVGKIGSLMGSDFFSVQMFLTNGGLLTYQNLFTGEVSVWKTLFSFKIASLFLFPAQLFQFVYSGFNQLPFGLVLVLTLAVWGTLFSIVVIMAKFVTKFFTGGIF